MVTVAAATELGSGDFSFCAWVYGTTFTSARRVMQHFPVINSTARQITLSGTGGAVQVINPHTTDIDDYTTNTNPLVLNTWNFIGVTADPAGAANEHINIYIGSLTAVATECGYGSITDGAAAADTLTAVGPVIGNRNPSNNRAWQGRIAMASYWDRVLTISEIRQQQFRPQKESGCVMLHHYGFNNGGSEIDYSGEFNAGTITGATVAPHAPIQTWGGALSYSPYVVAAAAGIAIPVITRQFRERWA